MSRKSVVGLLLLTLFLGACSSSSKREKTLADLKPVAAPAVDKSLPVASRRQVIESYQKLLLVIDDPEVKAPLASRLGSLLLHEKEAQQLAGAENGGVDAAQKNYYDSVVGFYQQLLQDFEGHEKNDKVLYELSKAYDLDGRSEESADALEKLEDSYPESAFLAESQFRRGETFFARGEYAQAEASYQKIVDSAQDSPFYANSLYMLGWSQFKRARYEDALDPFLSALDLAIPSPATYEKLTDSQRELVGDVMRVMALSFSYLEGAESLQALFAKEGRRHFEAELYEELGELFLSKERYRDTANTYAAFVKAYPLSDEATAFHVKEIEAYEQGDFPTLVMPAKQAYVESYGINSEYWRQKPDTHDTVRPVLAVYLDELARTAHADAQDMRSVWDASTKRRKLDFKELDIRERYRTAGRWYKEFIQTFPEKAARNDTRFLLAESQFESGDYADAVESYEYIAYDLPDHKKGAEAGYAALLAYEQLLPLVGDPDRPVAGAAEAQGDDSSPQLSWRQRQTNSQLRFSETFPNDKRAASVLLRAAEELLSKGDHAAAVAAVRQLPPSKELSAEQQLNRWLVLSHGEFELENYPAAEVGYRQVMSLLPRDDKRRAEINENLAASVYKQGEAALAADDKRGAVEQFLRVVGIAGDSSIAMNAQFDAATYLLELEEWSRAITVLRQFRQRYPDHELTRQVPGKLVLAYQENEQWRDAAAELEYMVANKLDPDQQREAQYLAADLYVKSGDTIAGIQAYERYVRKFRKPFPTYVEALQQLIELNDQENRLVEKRDWQQRLINADARAGSERSDRSRLLAAAASLSLAEAAHNIFNTVPLTQPLKKSLKQKRAAMQIALRAYKRAADYGVQKYATHATHNIAQIYAQLSKELLDSPRPNGMSALALEQYSVLLEEQAFPFEEKAIEIHETNTARVQADIYDDWVKKSYAALAKLLPARYGKEERKNAYSEALH